MDKDKLGTLLAQKLTAKLQLEFPSITYKQASNLVYGVCNEIADYSSMGDWISMPDGTTFTCTFKP